MMSKIQMPLTVFYIDDEQGLCEVFYDEFSSDEVKVFTFVDPKLAIAEAQRSPPDLVYIDYRLPGINGDQVARALPHQIPKYLVTGDLSVSTAFQFEEIFSKPLNTEKVRKTMERLRDRKKNRFTA